MMRFIESLSLWGMLRYGKACLTTAVSVPVPLWNVVQDIGAVWENAHSTLRKRH